MRRMNKSSNSRSGFGFLRSILSKPKRSQSEMVGFVLIVVVVVVAVMIFMLISLKKDSGLTRESVNAENLISSIMGYTTECAIVYEPNYDNIEDLIVSCAENNICSNLDKPACDYLSETLGKIIEGLIKTESQINSYELEVVERENGVENEIVEKISYGSCAGSVLKAQKLIPSSAGYDLIFRIALCKSNV